MPDEASHPPISESRKRLLVAARLQKIAGNLLTKADMAMFEREDWSPERRRAYIMAKVRPLADP